ncbi:MAG: radical SAM protein [Bacteroidales bacterium]|jgi:MoaA/NifB/PqqE/SkfB family radical SAM enzyme|nr:radical SAM protein [Bacteroidales bacterium]
MKLSEISDVLLKMADNKLGRKFIARRLDSKMYYSIVKNNQEEDLKAIKLKKYQWSSALLNRVVINMNKNYFSGKSLRKLSDVFINGAFQSDQTAFQKYKDSFYSKYGAETPGFLVISPSQKCNLKCTNCYACSNSETVPHLSYETFDRLVNEFRNEGGGRFIVISGGEPLMYKDGDKTLLDIFEKYNDVFFMFYTNGTLINKEMAERLAELGNAVPAISVEGYEKETDARRGKGVYKRILQAMGNMRNAGFPFLISVTATSENTDLLLSDDFYKYYFDELGATFMWQFQLMPIGRGEAAFNMMPSPQQRIKLYRKWEDMMNSRKYPVADFWNSGVLTNGCIAYGRSGGYLYIDWNGDIMPCVFVPYKIDNLNELYSNGKSFGDALSSQFMKNGRQWQYDTQLKDKMHANNLLMPCSIRDHYANFRKNILTANAMGENSAAEDIIKDKKYYDNLVNYDKELLTLTNEIWDKEYLSKS